MIISYLLIKALYQTQLNDYSITSYKSICSFRSYNQFLNNCLRNPQIILDNIEMADQSLSPEFNPESASDMQSSPFKENHPSNPKNSDCSTGKWTQQQNLAYVMFMEYYYTVFASKQKRKIARVFKAMSEHIPSRTAIQCRSHHQKELVKHGTVRKIITNFKNKFGKQYSNLFQQFSQQRKQKQNDTLLSRIDYESSAKSVEVQTDPIIFIDNFQQTEITSINFILAQIFSWPLLMGNAA